MIRLHFEGVSPTPLALGPAPWFKVSGNFIREGPHGEIAGTFRNHHWELESRHFIYIRCTEPAVLHFEDMLGGKTQAFGPFDSFQARDGTLFIGDRPFAKFAEETQLWHCYETETFWPTLVISAAKGKEKESREEKRSDGGKRHARRARDGRHQSS